MKNVAKSLIISRLNTKVSKLLTNHNITIIGVTGSVGKTITKQAIGEVLSSTRKVRYSEDSYNTDIGVPLSLFGMKVPAKLWNARAWQKIFKSIDAQLEHYEYDTVVLELADDELKAMKKVLRIVKLDIGVISAIAPVHMERLKDMQTVVHDNWQIAANAKKIIYNADNEALRKKAYKTNTYGFGLQHGVVRFTKLSRNKSGFLQAQLQIGKHKKTIHTCMIGRQNLYNILAAAAVANQLDLPFEAICFELSQIKAVKGRMNLLAGEAGARIIDDSYNASPETVIAALDTLKEFKGRKIAILGSMNELGGQATVAHQQVGERAAKSVDLLVTVGALAEELMAPAAAHAGLKSNQIKVFRTPYEAGHYVKGILQKDDIILVKGSQDSVYTEEATRILLSSKLDANQLLVRQSPVWKRRKKKSFAT